MMLELGLEWAKAVRLVYHLHYHRKLGLWGELGNKLGSRLG